MQKYQKKSSIQKYYIIAILIILFTLVINCKTNLYALNNKKLPQVELKNQENILDFNEQNLKKFNISQKDFISVGYIKNNISYEVSHKNSLGTNLYDVLKNSGENQINKISFLSIFITKQNKNTYNNFKYDSFSNCVSLINQNIIGDLPPTSLNKLNSLVNKYKNNIFNLKSKKWGSTSGQVTILGKNNDGTYKVVTAKHVLDLITNNNPINVDANFYLNGNQEQIELVKNIQTKYDFSYADIKFKNNLKIDPINIKVKMNENKNVPMYTVHSVAYKGEAPKVEIEAAHFLGTLNQNDYMGEKSFPMDLTWLTMHAYVGVSGSAVFNTNGEVLGVVSAGDKNFFNKRYYNLKATFTKLSRPNKLPTITTVSKSVQNINNINVSVSKTNVKQYNVNNHKKGWGHNASGKWIWFTGTGQELYNQPGWQKWKGSWLFENADRTYSTSEWKKVSGKWYHFNKDGYINRGWRKISRKWYHFAWSGKMDTKGWHKISGKWYYMNKGGDVYTKKGWWKSNSGKWMYSKGSNGYATNEKINSYYFDTNGYLK